FRVTGEPDDSTLLTFREFECNRIPISAPVSGGFFTGGTVSLRLKITVSGDQTITVEKENDIMIYDLNRDGRVGPQDAVYALRQGNMKAAVYALQCITGK
ncbi:MAG: hypothetical protein GY746_17515, partial [Gammaproteobacteria bacterium]|nr:hypothetical protein [Gammaproteobacteria bacterium]